MRIYAVTTTLLLEQHKLKCINTLKCLKKMPEYQCVECESVSVVSYDYFKHAYVRAQCCSVHCYKKKNKISENTQEGTFELQI